MVWEFPAVSQTRVEFWNEPQYTQRGMWWFTLLFGFFGLHHLYLRSPQTALMFFIANCISLGYPWMYDLVQLSNAGGETVDSLNKHGLAHPWGALGLAQGMWKESESFTTPVISRKAYASPPASAPPASVPPASVPPASVPPASAPPASVPPASAPPASVPPASAPPASVPPASVPPASVPPSNTEDPSPPSNSNMRVQGGGALSEGPPNPLWFLLYALSIPAAPLAQMIAGDSNNAVGRFLDLTIIPLGFLFYFCAMMYDYLILFLFPADLLVAGSKRFFPFTYLGMDADGHSERLTGKSEIKPCPADGFIMTMFRISLPLLSYFFPGLGKTVEAALATKDKIIDTAVVVKEQVIDKGQEAIEIAGKVGRLSERIQNSQNAQGGQAGNGGYGDQAKGKYMDPSSGKPYGTMVGGYTPTFSTLDYAALGSLAAVISGGFLLSINRSFNAGNDSPPDPRAI